MIPVVACVLRSGGDYTRADVATLRDMVRDWLPGAPFVCLSDCPVPCERIPLKFTWPGWWAKLELFRPDLGLGERILGFDLDTVVIGSLAEIAAAPTFTLLSDFYHLGLPASGVMMLDRGARARVWAEFMTDPDAHMTRCEPFDAAGVRGDGKFIGEVFGLRAARWQEVVPGQIVSWKVHCKATGRAPDGARVVCFHGRPRPRETEFGRRYGFT